MLPCDGCAYRTAIPGDAHSRCVFDWQQNRPALAAMFFGINPRNAQWFRFPFNYDPTWGPNTCPERAAERDPGSVAPSNPLADLASLFPR